MFNSTILDVVIGLVSVFLAISLLTSAVTEAISTMLGLRASTLLSGVKQLLNDPGLNGLAHAVYNHGLVNPLSNGQSAPGTQPAVTPSYIDSKSFALALIDGVERAGGQAQSLEQAIDAIGDPQLRSTMQALYKRADGQVEAFRKEVAGWFDSAMDRVSGSYKRWSKLLSFLIGFVAAGLLNADPVHLASTVWQHPELGAQLAKLDPPQNIEGKPLADQAQQLLQRIEGAGPLLGWSRITAADTPWSVTGLTLMVLGWLVTAGAAMFGAPFWFDILQRVVQLRGTGRPVRPTGPEATTP